MLFNENELLYVASQHDSVTKQSGAVEACWAHNPEVRGSKPRSANFFSRLFQFSTLPN